MPAPMKAHFTSAFALISGLLPAFASACPRTDSRASLTRNFTTGETYEQAGDIYARFHPASLTKVISMIVVAKLVDEGRLNLGTEIPLGTNIGNGHDVAFRALGRNQTVQSILEMAAPSTNIGLEGIANYVGYDYFITRMNQTARELNAVDTNFVSPTGLTRDTRHYSTIADWSNMMANADAKYHTYLVNYLGNENIIFGGWQNADGTVNSSFRHTSAVIRDRTQHVAQGHAAADWAKTGTVCSGKSLVALGRYNGQMVLSLEVGMRVQGYSGRDQIVQENLDGARNRILYGSSFNVATQTQAPQPLPGGGVRMFGPAFTGTSVVNASVNTGPVTFKLDSAPTLPTSPPPRLATPTF